MANTLNGEIIEGAIVGTTGADTIILDSGADLQVTAGKGNDKITVKGGIGLKVFGGAGNDTIAVSGGSGSTIYGDVAATSKSGDGEDTITVTGGEKHTIYAGGGVDQISVEGGTSNSIYGGSGDDIINIVDGTNKIIAGAGVDTINIKGGTKNTVYGDTSPTSSSTDGADNINVMGGTKNTIYGAGGADNIETTGGEGNAIYGGAAGDIITINGGTNTIYGDFGINTQKTDGDDIIYVKNGESNITYTAGGADTAYGMGGTKNRTYLGAGSDTIYLQDGSGNLFYGGAGEDQIFVEGGSKNNLYGDGATAAKTDGNDTFTLTGGTENYLFGYGGVDTFIAEGGSQNRLYGGAGDDVFEIKDGTNRIYGGAGNNQFTVTGGSKNIIYTNDTKATDTDGNDIVIIKGGSNTTVNDYGGDDTFIIENSNSNKLYGRDGKDTFYINSGKNNAVYGGAGDDTYIIDWAKVGTGTVISQTSAAAEDKDTIILNSESSNFSFTLNEGTGTLKDATGKTLKIEGFGNGTDSITFSDATLSTEELLALKPPIPESKTLDIDDGAEQGIIRFKQVNEGTVSGYTVNLNKGTANEVEAVYDTREIQPDVIMTSPAIIANNNTVNIAAEGVVLTDAANDIDGDVKAVHLVVGEANNNTVTLKGGNVEGDLMGAQLEIGTATGNKVVLAGGSADEAYGAEGCALAASKNSVNLTAGTFHKLYGAVAEDGNLSENTVIITGGAVGEVYGAKTGGGDLTQNTVTITGGTADTVYGAEHYSGNAVHNAVVIGGQAEINQVYGLNEARGKATNTSVTITDHAVVNTVYGAYISSRGLISETTVTVEGSATVNGNIFVNSSNGAGGTEAVGTGYVTVRDNAQVKGVINGGWSNDVITVSGGKVGTIYGGSGDDVIIVEGGSINYIYGAEGSDKYVFTNLSAGDAYVINNAYNNAGDKDVLDLSAYAKNDFSYSLGDYAAVLTHKASGATITLNAWKNNPLDKFVFADNTYEAEAVGGLFEARTPQKVIKDLLHSLDVTTKQGLEAMDEAIAYCSEGKFTSLAELADSFMADLEANSGAAYTLQQQQFLEDYCDINLFNEDTGSILGADAGGPEVKNKRSVVEEAPGASLADLDYSTLTTKTILAPDISGEMVYGQERSFSAMTVDKLTFYWDEANLKAMGDYEEKAKKILAGIMKVWFNPSQELVEEATGLRLDAPDSKLYTLADGTKGLQVYFVNQPGSSFKAMVQYMYGNETVDGVEVLKSAKEVLFINLADNMDEITDISGNSNYSDVNNFLDRTLAHELVHGVMDCNTNCMSTLPTFIKEGLAELVHGIDDIRQDILLVLADPAQKAYLRDILTDYSTGASGNSDIYGASYMLLRYLAKQAAETETGAAVTPAANTVLLQNVLNTSVSAYGGYCAATMDSHMVGIFGGYGAGAANNNQVTLDSALFSLSQQANGGYGYSSYIWLKDTFGGYALNAEASGNTVEVYNSYIESGSGNSISTAGGAIGGYANNGNALNNTVELINSHARIAAGAYVDADSNTYVAQGNRISLDQTLGYAVAGAITRNADAVGNQLSIGNCRFESFFDEAYAESLKASGYICWNTVYGARTYGEGKALNNVLEIKDSHVYMVYGARSVNGAVEGNKTYISGDTLIRGNVYTGYSDNGAVNGNRVYITGDTQVQGSVYGFQGSDVILVGSSKGIKVNADQGDDLIYSLSANNYLNGHYGSDTFIIDWRKAGGVTVYDTPNGGDVNTVKLVNGSASTISASKSGNHLLLTNGAGDTLTLSNWSYGTYDSLQLVSDSGVTTYSRSALDAALNSLGTATLQFSDTSLAANAVVTALTEQDKQHLLIVSGNF